MRKSMRKKMSLFAFLCVFCSSRLVSTWTTWLESTPSQWTMRWTDSPPAAAFAPSALSPPARRVCHAHQGITSTRTATSVRSVQATLTWSRTPHWALKPVKPVGRPAGATRFVWRGTDRALRLRGFFKAFYLLLSRTTDCATATVTSLTRTATWLWRITSAS